ncbi:MAG TPA: DUF4304 domain-containing protein [Clostridia bacterium]|nr:DUF4304 domain-containing protein [Clostridia bacterium]
MNKRLRSFIERAIKPPLVASGFDGEQELFWRERDWALDEVHVQQSSYDGPGASNFTLNVGILIPEIHNLIWGEEETRGFPNCLLQRRIGELCAADRPQRAVDLWWTLTGASSLRLEVEVKEAVQRYVIPFLDRIRSLSDVRTELERSSTARKSMPVTRLGTAVLSAKLGDQPAAETEFRALLRDNQMAGWASRVKRVASGVGIQLE